MASRGKNPTTDPDPIAPEPMAPVVRVAQPPIPTVSPAIATSTPASQGVAPDLVSRIVGLAVVGQVASLVLAGVGTLVGFYLGLNVRDRERSPAPVAVIESPGSTPSLELAPIVMPKALPIAERRPAKDATVIRTVSRPDGPTWSVPGVKPGVSTRIHVLGGVMRHDAVFLENTDVRDDDLAVLRRLPALTWLNLDHTSITDAGLKSLEAVKSLRRVSLVGVKGITARGVESLKEAIPEVEVVQGR